MPRNQLQPVKLLQQLQARRRRLRMSYGVLAKRSGVSMPTVVRVLSGRHLQASFENVLAIAEALGMEPRFEARVEVEELLEQQARQKARRLVGMLQGTSALEAQALEEKDLNDMMRQTVHELLAGSRQRLWSE